jgi:hypothetical protein
MISEKRNSFVDNPEYNFSRGMFAIPFEVEIKRRKGGWWYFFIALDCEKMFLKEEKIVNTR